MGPEILLVTSPGLAIEAYAPLIEALRREGARVRPVSFPCAGDAASYTALVARAGAGREQVVVAHGLGATLALRAAPELDVRRWVLLGPVLDVVAGPGLEGLAAMPVRGPVELAAAGPEGLDLWVGPGASEVAACLSPRFAREVQGWIAAGHVPVDPAAVGAPVWIGLGQLDEVASLEATLPASRRFADREVDRMGLGHLDPRDYTHLDLVRDPVCVRRAVRAAVGGR